MGKLSDEDESRSYLDLQVGAFERYLWSGSPEDWEQRLVRLAEGLLEKGKTQDGKDT